MNGGRYTIAALCQVEPGRGEAQAAARDLLDDLAPGLVLVVGIAGGLPADDIRLGDVISSMRIHDFTVEARSGFTRAFLRTQPAPVGGESVRE